jgi:hypothetical protein
MIPYDLDPSLHSGEPESASLDDGFSPPVTTPSHHHESGPTNDAPVDPALWSKSEF